MTGTGRPYPVEELLTAARAEILAEQRSDADGAVKVALSKGRLLSQSGGRASISSSAVPGRTACTVFPSSPGRHVPGSHGIRPRPRVLLTEPYGS